MANRRLDGKKIIFGITGGVGACKAPEIIKAIRKEGADVRVVMTPSATKLVWPFKLRLASGKQVHTDLFEKKHALIKYLGCKALKLGARIEHIELVKNADLILIAPASANTIQKLAHGAADNLLTTMMLAKEEKTPLLLAPAMNTKMYLNRATQENLEALKNRGCFFVGPCGGKLACGEVGIGRLATTEEILNKAVSLLIINKEVKMGDIRPLNGVRIIITAGATSVYIDEVRKITNIFKGTLGQKIAEEAVNQGASVVLLRAEGATYLPPKNILERMTVDSFDTPDELLIKVRRYLNTYQPNVIIHSAAVSDYQPVQYKGKIKSGQSKLAIEMTPTVKVVDRIKKIKKDVFLVKFKLEVGRKKDELLKIAYDSMLHSNADLMVANDLRMDMDREGKHRAYIIDPNKNIKEVEGKENIAKELLGIIAERIRNQKR